MNESDSDVPDDKPAAAARALRDLGQLPGDDPVLQLEHVVTLLFAQSTELLAEAAESLAEDGRWDTAVLERLERVYERCLTGLAPLAAAAAAANPGERRLSAPDQDAERPGGWGCDWKGQMVIAPVPLWRML